MLCPNCGFDNPEESCLCVSCNCGTSEPHCSNDCYKSRGFTLPPTVLVMLLMIVLMLIAVLVPAIRKCRIMAGQLVCGTNLKSLSCAISTYSFDYDDLYPTGDKWCDLLIDHIDVELKTFRCGKFTSEDFCYGLNKNLVGLKLSDVPRDIVMLFEIECGRNVVGGPQLLYTGRHNDHGCNIVYTDGIVEWVDAKNLDDLKWTVEAED